MNEKTSKDIVPIHVLRTAAFLVDSSSLDLFLDGCCLDWSMSWLVLVLVGPYFGWSRFWLVHVLFGPDYLTRRVFP